MSGLLREVASRAPSGVRLVVFPLWAGALTLAVLALPVAWTPDSGPAPAPSADERPPVGTAPPVVDHLRPGAVQSAWDPDRSVRRPTVSRSGPRARSDSRPRRPSWLADCETAPAESKEPNGLISDENLCDLPSGLHLRGDAAEAWWRLSTDYRRRFGEPLCMTDAYRDLGAQQQLSAAKPGLAARPGTSNHGWGVAVDLCGGAESYGTAQHEWLRANAESARWANPSWAQQGGSKPEPWHWEFDAAAR